MVHLLSVIFGSPIWQLCYAPENTHYSLLPNYSELIILHLRLTKQRGVEVPSVLAEVQYHDRAG